MTTVVADILNVTKSSLLTTKSNYRYFRGGSATPLHFKDQEELLLYLNTVTKTNLPKKT